MQIHVRFQRDENIEHYNAEEADIDLEEYVAGVVAAEIGNSKLEACKALAVAARTNAVANNSVSDTSPQAFRSSRLNNSYANALQSAEDTASLVLYCNNKLANPASYSSNNGGRTRSSQDRWGTYKSWLIEQDDPWDNVAKVTGHRVGASQYGLKYAASQGITYQEMLQHYYPTTYLHNLNTNQDIQFAKIEIGKEVDNVAYATVKASWLIDKFKYMVDNHWPYVANGASERSVDCSGAFTYWYNKAGSYMYHGSNTMYRKYSTQKGLITSMTLVPGMAVYKRKTDGKEPDQYNGDGIGNMYHVGLYIGNGKVAEAKGTNYGCVYSNISEWTYCSRLKYTNYDVTETDNDIDVISSPEVKVDIKGYPIKAIVTTESGPLHIRSAAASKAASLGLIPKGTTVTVTGKVGDWYAVKYGSVVGYCFATYLTLNSEALPKKYIVSGFDISYEDAVKIKDFAQDIGITISITEAGDD